MKMEGPEDLEETLECTVRIETKMGKNGRWKSCRELEVLR